MGRLIDADDLIEAMEKVEEDYENMGSIPNWFTALRIIKEQPTAYDVEKVKEELEEETKKAHDRAINESNVNGHSLDYECFYGQRMAFSRAKEIVKAGGVE